MQKAALSPLRALCRALGVVLAKTNVDDYPESHHSHGRFMAIAKGASEVTSCCLGHKFCGPHTELTSAGKSYDSRCTGVHWSRAGLHSAGRPLLHEMPTGGRAVSPRMEGTACTAYRTYRCIRVRRAFRGIFFRYAA